MTTLDDLEFGASASTLAEGSGWQNPATSAVSPVRWREQHAPLVIQVDFSLPDRQLRTVHLSREVTPANLAKLRHLLRE